MLSEAIKHRRASSIAEVANIMTAIDRELSSADGVWWFNRLYLRVTLAVRDAMTTTTFLDPVFLERLDIVFANLYFDALAAGDQDSHAAPPAWRPLLECRHRQGLLPIQYALAGMNAHINRDLPVGIVATFAASDGAPGPSGVRRDDFQKVNDLLAAVEAQIKGEFATGIVGVVDAVGGPVDDAVAMWNIRAAREAAWTNAEVMWSLRRMPALGERFLSRLDHLTGFAGRGLLIPSNPLGH